MEAAQAEFACDGNPRIALGRHTPAKAKFAYVAQCLRRFIFWYQRNWKEHRRAQFKNTDGINRRFHSPACWDR
jgi:hypothetical protein